MYSCQADTNAMQCPNTNVIVEPVCMGLAACAVVQKAASSHRVQQEVIMLVRLIPDGSSVSIGPAQLLFLIVQVHCTRLSMLLLHQNIPLR